MRLGRLSAMRLVETLKTSDLRGMGGAGRPAFSKWAEVREESKRAVATYIICNGDESEPSTFKDRELLLRAPHLVIEGMVLGALLVGARRGYVYIRHEYPDQVHAFGGEISRARELEVVGPDVLGTGHCFEIEAFESPGGYVCGEQSALIEAIEEHRAEPRNRPPAIEANGLYGKPTLLEQCGDFRLGSRNRAQRRGLVSRRRPARDGLVHPARANRAQAAKDCDCSRSAAM